MVPVPDTGRYAGTGSGATVRSRGTDGHRGRRGGSGDADFLAAATGLPTILLTAALVVVVCFWLLAAVGVACADSFDADVDLRRGVWAGCPWRSPSPC